MMGLRRGVVGGAVVAAVMLSLVGAASALPRDPIVPPDLPGDGTPPPFVRPANGFAWSVPSRFGRLDSRGIVDFHWNEAVAQYEASWARPTAFPANFDGCPTASEQEKVEGGQPTANTYTWTLEDPAASGGTVVVSAQSCRLSHTWSTQGTYGVDLVITAPDGSAYEGRTAPYRQSIRIRDILIVSLGDSYGSGEGNPDRPAQVGWSPFKTVFAPAVWQDRRCHRSAYAGPAQAALEIERADAHTSVTFVSFACSGATIDTPYFGGGDPLDPYAPADRNKPIGTGVLGPYQGAEPPEKDDYGDGYPDKVPSQIDQLKAAVANRPIDALIVSGGGNDIGFGPVAAVCVLYGDCKNHFVFGKLYEGPRPLYQRFGQDLAALGPKYDDLNAALTAPANGLNIAKVYVTEYPDSTRDDDGSPCGEMLQDVVPWGMAPLLAAAALIYSHPVPVPWYRIDASEAEWASNVVLPGLNGAVAAAASRHDWTFVGGISSAFAGPGYGHGYCADNSWIRNASDAIAIQGPWYDGLPPDTSETKGTLHPTTRGHQVYKERLLAYLKPYLLPSSSTPPVSPAFSSAVTAPIGANGWLLGGSSVTVEATDTAGIRGVAFSVNGTNGCRVGITCTTSSTTTSGRVTSYRWTFDFAADGVYRLDFAVAGDDGGSGAFSREVKVDLASPTDAAITESASVPANNGWFRVPVTLAFGGTDAAGGSGIVAVEYALDGGVYVRTGVGAPVTLTGDGVRTVDYRALDGAGRFSPVERTTISIDRTAPQANCAGADGAWHGANVAISCSPTDSGGSGLDGPGSFTLATSVAAGDETSDAQTGSESVCDRAANCVSAGPVGGNKVDRKAPSIAIASPVAAAYALHAVVLADYGCGDGGSGVARCAGPVATGSGIDTASVGAKSFAVEAGDNVGNTASASVAYDVHFVFGGFFAPLSNVPAVNDVKAGQSVPVKFSLAGSQGLGVLAAGSPSANQVACDAGQTGVPVGDEFSASVSGLQYDSILDQYSYVWKTNRTWAGTCRQLTVVLVDGTSHTLAFRFR